MQLSENSLWVRSYNFLIRIANNFWDKNEEYNQLTQYSHRNSQIDICKFIRRFVVWAPIYTILYSVYYGIIFLLLFYVNVVTFGAVPSFFASFIFLVALTIGVVGGGLVIFTLERITKYLMTKKEAEPSVVKEWYKSVKTKTCTLIRIGDK